LHHQLVNVSLTYKIILPILPSIKSKFTMNKNRNRGALNMAKNNSSKKISRRKFLEISALATAGVLTGLPTAYGGSGG
jgi:hypothetical protein